MKRIRLHLGSRSYPIIIGSRIAGRLGACVKRLAIGDSAYIISNARLHRRYGRALSDSFVRAGIAVKFRLVPDTEKSKSLATVTALIDAIARFEKKRRIFIVAFGGGVVGDLAGFVASIYKRGLPYIQVPTTLLAQVDSSIGGKTAVDLCYGKNLVGSFYQPRIVFSDTHFLGTLGTRQLGNGLAEIIKYAAIKDPRLFTYLERHYGALLKAQQPALEFTVSRCSAIKAKIVEQDEKEEKGIRTILNFGHTIGHAIEAAGGYKGYGHGEAIALGMLAACSIGTHMGLTDQKTSRRVKGLIEAAGLPAVIAGLPPKRILTAHYRDKKFIGTKNRFVLLSGIGKAEVVENIPLAMIKKAIQELY